MQVHIPSATKATVAQRRRLAVVTLFSVLAACGGEDGDATVPLEQYFPEIAAATCEPLFECCDAAELMAQFEVLSTPPTNAEECVDAALMFAGALGVDESISRGIEAGRLRYDADAATACVASIRDADCQEFSRFLVEGDCEAVFVGLVATGDPCEQSDECADPDAYCFSPDSPNYTCIKRRAIGEFCMGVECTDGAYCPDQICVAQLADGEACTDLSECLSDYCDGTCMQPPRTCDGT